MALIKCPECGAQISDKAEKCIKCGYPLNKGIIDTDLNTNRTEAVKNIPEISAFKSKVLAFSIIGIVFLLFIGAMFFKITSKKCAQSGCENERVSHSRYCYLHTCSELGCSKLKSEDDAYCIEHMKENFCMVDGCGGLKAPNSDYCSEHTCEQYKCYNIKKDGSDYCIDHQLDMRGRLFAKVLDFSLGTDGEIEFNFGAMNVSGKEIECVRFDLELRNKDDRLVKDRITEKTFIPIEVVGPIEDREDVAIEDKVIGYCDECARIDINEITIVYSDGTSETGRFGYCHRKK